MKTKTQYPENPHNLAGRLQLFTLETENLTTFCAKHPGLEEFLARPETRFVCSTDHLTFIYGSQDAAAVGKLLGREGWKRVRSYADKYNWAKEFPNEESGGYRVILNDVETLTFPPEVSPKEFPLQLEDNK